MPYAAKTEVPVAKSEAEIRGLLRRYGASEFFMGERPLMVAVQFKANDRYVRFVLPIPSRNEKRFTHIDSYRERAEGPAQKAYEQEIRRRWRALALVIKAKLEAVASGITTFEDEFMAHIVLPGGQTVSEIVRPAIARAYAGGADVPLLPAWQEP